MRIQSMFANYYAKKALIVLILSTSKPSTDALLNMVNTLSYFLQFV